MLFSRNALGLEITQHGLKMALIGGKVDMPKLVASESAEFPAGTVRLLHREPNVINHSAFVGCVREAYLRLLGKTSLVSVSLPDAAGRVMLLDLETRFKNREEGKDIIRWKLKKSLPMDVNDIHLDYQVLHEKETGEISTLVSIISHQVIGQYEDLLIEAGLQPNQIDFTTFNLYRYFAKRLEVTENMAFMAFYGSVLSILLIHHGALEFYRTKEVYDGDLDMNRVFLEISSSLMFYKDKNPGHQISEVFCLAPPEHIESFSSVVSEACGTEPVILDPESFIMPMSAVGEGRARLFSLAAAAGAAMRNL